MQETQTRITMKYLFERRNRNKHFQIIKENRWISVGRVFTGLGLYKDIMECGSLALKTEIDDWKNASTEAVLKKYDDVQKEILPCIREGKDKTLAKKNSLNEIIVTDGAMYD